MLLVMCEGLLGGGAKAQRGNEMTSMVIVKRVDDGCR